MPKPYKREIIREGGYCVVFSNDGIKKDNTCPNPVNYKKERVKCGEPGCEKETTAQYGGCTSHQKFHYKVDWVGRMLPLTSNQDGFPPPSHSEITEVLIAWAGEDKRRLHRLDKFIRKVLDDKKLGVVSRTPDANTLQAKFEKKAVRGGTPDFIANKTRKLIDKIFPDREFSSILVDWNDRRGNTHKLPIRIVAATLAIGFACEEANRADAWFYNKYGAEIKKYNLKLAPRMASAYMSSIYYFLRRYTKATKVQATKASSVASSSR